MQIHSAEAAAEPWGPNSHQEVSSNNSSLSVLWYWSAHILLCFHILCSYIMRAYSSLSPFHIISLKKQRQSQCKWNHLTCARMWNARHIWAFFIFRNISSSLRLCHELFVTPNSPLAIMIAQIQFPGKQQCTRVITSYRETVGVTTERKRGTPCRLGN